MTEPRAHVREDDDIPRFAGLPLEEFEQGTYVPPAGHAFVDTFDWPEGGTSDLTLLRSASTGRLTLEIRIGEPGDRGEGYRLLLPLDVPVWPTSFGLLARALAGGGPLTVEQRDGQACLVCGRDDAPMRPAGLLDGVQVFACAGHAGGAA